MQKKHKKSDELTEKIQAPPQKQNKQSTNKQNNSWQALKAEIEGCKIDDSEDEETTKLIQDPQKPQTLNTKKQNC